MPCRDVDNFYVVLGSMCPHVITVVSDKKAGCHSQKFNPILFIQTLLLYTTFSCNYVIVAECRH